MKREQYKSLISWKNSPNRKPLLVQGARQVGKTWLIKEFGQSQYEEFVTFNFEETPALASLFEKELSPKTLISSLSAYSGKTIRQETTLIFFDEIQICPRALTSLKYFCEEAPDFHIIAAGSLLGVGIGKTSAFPVGKVNFLSLYPLSFFEFLQANGEELLVSHLKGKKDFESLPEILHEKLSMLLKTFTFTGGMPEVVKAFVDTGDFNLVRTLQKEILNAYQRDFSKYSTPAQAKRISEIWQSIPAQLARENKKFKYSDVRKSGRATQFDSAIEWLRSAGLVYTSVNVSTAQLPLSAYCDPSHFKAYLLDCGLLGAMVDLPASAIVEHDFIYSQYNGAFIENLVAVTFAVKISGKLFYWSSNGIAEVDFLIVNEDRILPLEVKSGLNRNIKSLRVYSEKFSPVSIYRTSPRNFERIDDFANIPLYGIELFPELR